MGSILTLFAIRQRYGGHRLRCAFCHSQGLLMFAFSWTAQGFNIPIGVPILSDVKRRANSAKRAPHDKLDIHLIFPGVHSCPPLFLTA